MALKHFMREQLVSMRGTIHSSVEVAKTVFKANATINAVQAANGTMTLEDLKNYNVVVREPISIDYRGYKVFSIGAPSGGSVGLSIMKIVEGYEAKQLSMVNLSTHRLDEAMRFSYAARAELGDPDYFSYMHNYEAHLLDPKTAAKIRGKISDNHTHDISHYSPKGFFNPENHGTSHVVTADASGMTITSTSTVNLLFGSQLIVPETGKSLLHLTYILTLLTR